MHVFVVFVIMVVICLVTLKRVCLFLEFDIFSLAGICFTLLISAGCLLKQ